MCYRHLAEAPVASSGASASRGSCLDFVAAASTLWQWRLNCWGEVPRPVARPLQFYNTSTGLMSTSVVSCNRFGKKTLIIDTMTNLLVLLS